VARYRNPAGKFSEGFFVAVSPDGSKVFMVGTVGAGFPAQGDTATAYNAATGAQLWTATYSSPGLAGPASIAVSKNGERLYIIDTISPSTGSSVYLTVTYRT
jgi:DNA-binding beta-propeller fold protein YncE